MGWAQLQMAGLACLIAGNAIAQEEPELLEPQDVDLESGDTAGPDDPEDTEPGDGLFFNGYLRLGVGNTDGDNFYTFKLDGAQTKYRLGNESDVYSEFGVGYRTGLGNSTDLVAEFMANGYGDSNALNQGAEFAGDSGVVQAYAGLERLGSGVLSESFLWAGRRYYRRRDVHMTDFYYENLSGDGIGLENIRMGNSRVSLAAFYYEDDDIDYESATIDARLHDIPIGGNWFGEAAAAYIDGKGDDAAGGGGYSVRFHAENTSLGWGETRNSLMYGAGAGLDFNSIGAFYADEGDSRLRLLNQTLIKSSEDLESQATAVLDISDIAGNETTWVSLGIRPQYNFTADWGAALELGYDWIDDDDGDRSLTKVTLAPFYSFGQKGYFARPQIRAFVTWAKWSDRGAITEQPSFGTATDGTSAGIQLEHWW